MTLLNIYSDESGTMPIDNTNDMFLTSSIAVFGNHPFYNQKSGHKKWLIEKLNENKAIPFVSYILPDKEYCKKLKLKLSKMNVLARYTRLITGANTKYLDKEGFRSRNYIWSFCMLQSISNTILTAISLSKIDQINIYIDEKTFSQPAKNYFITILFGQLNVMTKTMNKLKYHIPNTSKVLMDRIKSIKNNMYLYWKNDAESTKAKHGLELAHYLGYHFHKDFFKDNSSSIINLLKGNGYIYFQSNVTDLLIKPMNKESIESWERKTGLREPDI